MQCSYCDVRWVKVTFYYDPLYTTNWHICKGSRGWYLSRGGRCARYNHDWPLAFLRRGLSMYFASSSRREGRQAYQHLAAARDTRIRVSQGTVPGSLFGEVRRRETGPGKLGGPTGSFFVAVPPHLPIFFANPGQVQVPPASQVKPHDPRCICLCIFC